MKEIDPGHQYSLAHLDGNGETLLTFVKREGAKYPGNIGHYEGTNLQEVIRACMARIAYLDRQISDVCNNDAIDALRDALWALEARAARRHGRELSAAIYSTIEHIPVCVRCGHVNCCNSCAKART